MTRQTRKRRAVSSDYSDYYSDSADSYYHGHRYSTDGSTRDSIRYGYSRASTYKYYQEPQPCWLLFLAPELLFKILYECPQQSRARMARTVKALHQISLAALFRNVQLPQYSAGETFRQACRWNLQRKNQIQSLDFPASLEWIEWLSWDSAISPMPLLRCIDVWDQDLGRRAFRALPNLWETLQTASELAPHIQQIRFHYAYGCGGIGSRFSGMDKLRRLDLEYCEMDADTLEVFSRSLPALTTISILSHNDDRLESVPQYIPDTWLESLTHFQQLSTLRIGGGVEFQSTRLHDDKRLFTFPSLEALILNSPSFGWNSLPMLDRLSLPRLRQLELCVGYQSVLKYLAESILSDRLPQLSLLSIFYQSPYSFARTFSVAPLLRPLKEAGFVFELVDKLGPGCIGRVWWKAKRGEYDGEKIEL